jgi:hypothetical protein
MSAKTVEDPANKQLRIQVLHSYVYFYMVLSFKSLETFDADGYMQENGQGSSIIQKGSC